MKVLAANSDGCQVCDGDVRGYRHAWLFRCMDCGVLSANSQVSIPMEISDAGLDEAAREVGLASLRRRNNSRILAALRQLAPARARLLDVGSGPGFLLADAAAAGFQAQGVEPDANVLRPAERGAPPVRHGYFPDVLGREEQFDVIVFNDVLEHIPRLARTLQACLARLAPGGVLCLNCPDQHGFFFRTATLLDRLGIRGPYDRLWQRGLPSPHVWYFTPDLLDRAASVAGLTPVRRVRLATIEPAGLWSRIRSVRDASLAVSMASYVFSLAVYPLLRLLPSDATACFYTRPA